MGLICLGVAGEFFKTLQCLLLFRTFGPLVICVITVVKDALKTVPIYFIIFSSYGLFMWGMFNPFHQAFENNKEDIKLKFDFADADAAKSRDGLFHRLFWKILAADPNHSGVGLNKLNQTGNVTTPEATPSHDFAHVFILVAWAAYQIAICMLMINLLIAIMNDTFMEVRKNAPKNWKYSKSYYQGQFLKNKATFPSPFQWVYYIAYFVAKCKKCKIDRSKEKKEKKQEEKRGNYLKLMKNLIEIQQHIKLENTDKDKFADLRKDLKLDIEQIQQHIKLENTDEDKFADLRKDLKLDIEQMITGLIKKA